MASPAWVQQILTILKKEGKVPQDHSGEAVLTLNLGQGGLNSARFNLSETVK